MEHKTVIPAEAGTLVVKVEKVEKKDMVGIKRHTYYRSGVGKLLHMTSSLCPEVQNSVRELASPPESGIRMIRTINFASRE
eukprot:8441307-Ditylum_brightwellii.AAC.1